MKAIGRDAVSTVSETVQSMELVGLTEETATLDFKQGFEVRQLGDWCELIKDIVAMANSGGGRIVIGLNDDGTPSGHDVSAFRAVDPADIANKVHKYTEQQFADFRLEHAHVGGTPVAVLHIGEVRFPMIFSSPGDYESPPGKAKSAFRKGTVYFRHGAKSEPGTTEDLRNALERELARVKDFWLEGITKVVEAPAGSEVHIVQAAVSLTSENGAQPIRLTNSGDGPTFKVVDNDQLYPYRSKELIAKLSQVLGPKVASPYDILLVRKRYEVDANPNFSHKGRFGTRQYSEAFVEWLASEYARDNRFFQTLREASRARNS